MNPELFKYTGLYASPQSYGHKNNGKHAIPIIRKNPPKSLIDIGCGGNEFIKLLKNELPDLNAVGIDFASPFADIIGDICDMSLAEKFVDKFDLLTAFDVLEHLTLEQIPKALNVMAHVSKSFIFSISYKPSKREFDGHNLHPTIRSEEWWIRQILRFGGMNIKIHGRYITGYWQPLFNVTDETRCILVGNGPDILSNPRGDIIDSFDEVVRFNRYIIKGYENYTGTKTTLWSTYGRGRLPLTEDERPNRVIYTHGECGDGPAYDPEHLYRIPNWFWKQITSDVRSFSSCMKGFDFEHSVIPTSGLMVASWLLQVMNIKKIYLVGFDHFKKINSKQHHYWDARAFKKPKEHDGDAEAKIFQLLQEVGRIEYI